MHSYHDGLEADITSIRLGSDRRGAEMVLEYDVLPSMH